MPTTQPYHKSKANKTENCTRAKQVPGGMTSKAAHGKATMADTARQPKIPEPLGQVTRPLLWRKDT